MRMVFSFVLFLLFAISQTIKKVAIPIFVCLFFLKMNGIIDCNWFIASTPLIAYLVCYILSVLIKILNDLSIDLLELDWSEYLK